MAMYNKFITFLMLTFIVSISFAQQYTPMTAAGYQYKRAKVDSTLHIPSFCGVPNLRNSTAIQGALAMDTCGNKLYQWTHAAGWSTISTNAIDSLKRSNDSIFARKSGVWIFQYKDSVGGGGTTPSLQDVATVGNYYVNDNVDTLRLNSYDAILDIKHPIIWTNDIGGGSPNNILDFSYGPGSYENVAKIRFGDVSNSLGHGYVEITDKQSYFKNEMSQRTIIQNSPSTGGNAATNQTTYFPAMKGNTDTLATTEDIRNSAIDTSNKWVNNIYRTSGVDSIYYTIGSTTYAIKDSAGGGSSQNGRFGNDTATVVMAKVHNNSGVQLTNGKVVAFSTSGTSSDAPSVKLANNKADSTSANTFGFVSGTIAINDTGWVILSGKIEKLNTSAFANGDIIYLDSISGGYTKIKPVAPYHQVYLGTIVKANAGNGSIYVKVINGLEIEELHDVQITSKQNNQIIVYSDTQQLWKNRSIYSVVDTTNKIATKTNLAAKVNISDTATMLTPYIRLAGTGLTKSSQALSNNLSTGVAGGQSVVGGTAASNSLTLSSTSNATKGKILFGTSAYDEVNNRLGIGTTTPAYSIDVLSAANTGFYAKNTSASGRSDMYVANDIGNAGGFSIYGSTFGAPYSNNLSVNSFKGMFFGTDGTVANGGTSTQQFITGGYSNNPTMTLTAGNTGNVLIGTSTDAGYKLDVNGSTRINSILYTTNKVSLNSQNAYVYRTTDAGGALNSFSAGIYQIGTSTASGNQAAYFDFYNTALTFSVGNSNSRLISRTGIGLANLNNTAGSESGDMTFLTQSAGTAMSEKMRITGAGGLTINATNTAAGTTGNQTINKASGTVNIAAAGTTVTVTNNLVTTSSIVFAVIRTNDATATIKNVVPASGSFTINLNAATTAETSIGFFVIN